MDFALAIVMQQRLDAEAREKPPGTFAVIGIGSVGGRQMGYGDDINVLYVYDPANASDDVSQVDEFFVRVGCDLTAALRDDTHDGSLYRVGLPDWPQADGWLKACSLAECAEHFAAASDADERRALTRARPIAGDAELGARFMASCQPFVYRDTPKMQTTWRGSEKGASEIDLLTQTFQLAHGARHASLRSTGTLGALDALAKAGLIPEQICRELDHAYVYLRTAEHRAQLGLIDADDAQVERSKARVREICSSLS
jgi:[glutamine synthetase] adenylyltransferase / [glutamine synthetase]-adenylyl-L-tyrosine phosphorylase